MFITIKFELETKKVAAPLVTLYVDNYIHGQT